MTAITKTTATGSPATQPAAPVAGNPEYSHDIIRQSNLLRDALQSDRVRIGLFLGAGCPLGIYDEKGERSLLLIPDVAQLTKTLYVRLKALDEQLERDKRHIPCWDSLALACKDGGDTEPNVESILTELRALTGRKGQKPLDGIGKDRLKCLDEAICDLIVEIVGKSLPAHRCSYHRLASWIGGLQRAAPVELFTPNYDLLIEEAFERQRIPHFDGFVGSREPFFDIASIEQDAIPRRWARLWKLHGSINWERRNDGTVFRAQGRAAHGKAIIYPSHLKYDQSRRLPYLAMIDRLRSFFRAIGQVQSLGPPVLVVCGYSFSDDHLNEVLLDGLRGNPAAQCFVLEYQALGKAKNVVDFAGSQPNMTVLATDGAVVGNRKGPYIIQHSATRPEDVWIYNELTAGADKTAPLTAQCRLGDFHYFSLFLEQLYGGRAEVDHVANRD